MKDLRGITANRRLFSTIFIVPVVFTVVLPSIFVFTIHFTPDDEDLLELLSMLSQTMGAQNLELALVGLILNYILPAFFLVIPIMASSIMAASAFVGEKERHTLETLLYSPLTLRQIFVAKTLASFLLSMIVSVSSFAVMLVVLETELKLLTGQFILPGASWIVVMLLLSPALALVAVTLIVRGSAKAKSVEESQQAAAFLVLPIVLLIGGQFSGLFLLNFWIMLALGVVLALAAWVLLRRAVTRFTYETVLK